MYWANNEGNNMANPTNEQCAPIYGVEYGYPDGAQHQIFTDDFKCVDNIGDTLISSSSSKPSSIGSSPLTQLATPACASSLSVRSDGNAVFSALDGSKIYWTSNTGGKGTGPFTLTVRNDGNLVLSDSQSATLWSTGTAGVGCAPYSLKVRDQAKLTLVDCNGDQLWSSSNK